MTRRCSTSAVLWPSALKDPLLRTKQKIKIKDQIERSLVMHKKVQLDHGDNPNTICACRAICYHSKLSHTEVGTGSLGNPIGTWQSSNLMDVSAVAKLWGSAAVHAIGRRWSGAITGSAHTLSPCLLPPSSETVHESCHDVLGAL